MSHPNARSLPFCAPLSALTQTYQVAQYEFSVVIHSTVERYVPQTQLGYMLRESISGKPKTAGDIHGITCQQGETTFVVSYQLKRAATELNLIVSDSLIKC